jgi:hypothetical protein
MQKSTILARRQLISEKREVLVGQGKSGRRVRAFVFKVPDGQIQRVYMVPPRQSKPTVIAGKDATQNDHREKFAQLKEKSKSKSK